MPETRSSGNRKVHRRNRGSPEETHRPPHVSLLNPIMCFIELRIGGRKNEKSAQKYSFLVVWFGEIRAGLDSLQVHLQFLLHSLAAQVDASHEHRRAKN